MPTATRKSAPRAAQPGKPRPKETTHWEVKDNGNPKKAEWKEKPVAGGYQTVPTENPPSSPELKLLKTWIEDMNEWGVMMHEAVLELRERVEELERKCP
jgi:hypothetical protein